MNNIDSADEAEYNRVQSVLAERAVAARQETQNQHMADKMAGVDAADNFIPLSEMACVKEEAENPKNWYESFSFLAGNGFDFAQGVEDGINTSKTVMKPVINPLRGGTISFSAPKSIRDLFSIQGTRYNPSSLSAASAAKGIFKSSAKNVPVLFSFGVSLLVNIYEYQWGEHKDKGVISQEFGVSTIVDTAFAVGTGLLAAGAVAIVLAALGVGAVVSTPALIAVAATTALLAIGIGLFVDLKLEWPDQTKDMMNQRIDEIQGEDK